jgi:hypothetical protein
VFAATKNLYLKGSRVVGLGGRVPVAVWGSCLTVATRASPSLARRVERGGSVLVGRLYAPSGARTTYNRFGREPSISRLLKDKQQARSWGDDKSGVCVSSCQVNRKFLRMGLLPTIFDLDTESSIENL